MMIYRAERDYFFEFRGDVTYDKKVLTRGVCLASAVRSVDITAVSAEPLPAAYGDTVQFSRNAIAPEEAGAIRLKHPAQSM